MDEKIFDASEAELKQIPIDKIKPNPENPRQIFRQTELNELLESIRVYGIQVPVSVYKDGGNYYLIDGERRWRCSLKLNKKTIPALVQEKPSALDNLLLMFNIHALREQWDLLTIALKLPRVIKLLEKDLKRYPTEKEISEKTGLSRGIIRRCKLLIDLPEKYLKELLNELKKPKPQQKLSEDLFIEMEKSIRAVEKVMPELVPDRDVVRTALLDKYKADVITNIVHFRLIPKIARADKVHADRDMAVESLKSLFGDNNVSIEDAYKRSVSGAYEEKDILVRVTYLIDHLNTIKKAEIEKDFREKLTQLSRKLNDLLKG